MNETQQKAHSVKASEVYDLLKKAGYKSVTKAMLSQMTPRQLGTAEQKAKKLQLCLQSKASTVDSISDDVYEAANLAAELSRLEVIADGVSSEHSFEVNTSTQKARAESDVRRKLEEHAQRILDKRARIAAKANFSEKEVAQEDAVLEQYGAI
ncbi:hypothetical protein E2F43_10800 [Seongchinamella unica]|uniref:Uncharacterized protein n=1 Tax=Seongchinamella unica TaxID=2547392 RepID=A0A4V2ZXB7_9GAMM|nr:hypothetical protein [Seongchinamella unica]TDG13974.1 hypothetical protein E2F43_10800 [Seongchinamella unica]